MPSRRFPPPWSAPFSSGNSRGADDGNRSDDDSRSDDGSRGRRDWDSTAPVDILRWADHFELGQT